MKPNYKILDQTDPEFINKKLEQSDLDEITLLLKKRRSKDSVSPKMQKSNIHIQTKS
jgi:hypothetical protein